MKNNPMVLPALMVAMAIFCANSVESIPNTSWVWQVCNSEKIPSGSTYYDNVGLVLKDVLANTATNGYAYYFMTSRGGNGAPTAYAAGRCSDRLSPDDCHSCLQAITDGIWKSCANAIGAQVKLVDCFLRYEQFEFE